MALQFSLSFCRTDHINWQSHIFVIFYPVRIVGLCKRDIDTLDLKKAANDKFGIVRIEQCDVISIVSEHALIRNAVIAFFLKDLGDY